ncbi:hypothetical protein OG897_18490 [Streptomyces sp. NBC_00237]|uniref:hypothetical protein n=1 Tax=Streptomyces sp. NBC_00237 TaxID=2975687 RepID=UPI00224EFACA|nr:hypothetical protein [Streptomyces sp. NBC_00237]MCX5203427.1 hypothetical protein [Streptomyces sp. NBC_00237]
MPTRQNGPPTPAPGSIQVTEIRPENNSDSRLTEVAPTDVQAEDWGTFSPHHQAHHQPTAPRRRQ